MKREKQKQSVPRSCRVIHQRKLGVCVHFFPITTGGPRNRKCNALLRRNVCADFFIRHRIKLCSCLPPTYLPSSTKLPLTNTDRLTPFKTQKYKGNKQRTFFFSVFSVIKVKHTAVVSHTHNFLGFRSEEYVGPPQRNNKLRLLPIVCIMRRPRMPW